MITEIDTNTALVLIDLQKGVISMVKDQPIDEVIDKAAQLVAAFRAAKLPVVIVNVNPVGASFTKIRTQLSLAVKGPQPAFAPDFLEIIPEIKTTNEDIFITKKAWSAFCETTLHEELQNRNISQIVLAGVSTSIGVEGTARDASEYGYNIAFAVDTMLDRVPDAHEHSIKNIFPRIGELGTAAEIIEKLPKVE
ncbi:MAG: isochorismatase family protein [Ferruginibacter sp.]